MRMSGTGGIFWAVRRRFAAALLAVIGAGTIWCAGARALPGPPLQTPPAELKHALTCSGDLGDPSNIPVLLVHGTGSTPSEDWGSGLLGLLPAWGFPYCYLTFPNRAIGDMQSNVEYLVYAIRSIAAQSHSGKIAVIGHSQGGFLPLYALKFWPDLAAKVADSIGYAPALGRGTTFADGFCAIPCPPAFHQLRPSSAFLAAFNRQPYPTGPTYTSFLSRTDEIVTPQPAASTLPMPGAHTYIEQDLCPADTAEHLLIVDEQPFAALTHQLLSNPGQPITQPGRLPCGLLPSAPAVAPGLATFLANNILDQPQAETTSEPELRCYLNPTCLHPKLLPGLTARTTRSSRRHAPFRYTTTGTLQLPDGATNQCAGTVTIVIHRGLRTISKHTAMVGADCTYRSVATIRPRDLNRRRRGSLRLWIQARYNGDPELLPARTRWRHLNAG